MFGIRNLGVLRVDELLLPIREIYLINGGFRIVAELSGPQEACQGSVRLFTSEGFPVLDQARGDAAVISIPHVPNRDQILVTYDITIEQIGRKDHYGNPKS